MIMMSTRRAALAALAAVAALAVLPASAQPAAEVTHFRGTIDTVTGHTLGMTTLTGDKVTVIVPLAARIAVATAGTLRDVKPGSFIGSAARTLPDGTEQALEVHVFSRSLRGTGEGHYGWDLGSATTMTNGTVGAVVGTSGRTLTVNYADGRQTIIVPPDVPVVLTSKGKWSDVKPGAAAVVGAKPGSDGTLTAVFLIVGRNGVHPPM
jgi:hypothetical protein